MRRPQFRAHFDDLPINLDRGFHLVFRHEHRGQVVLRFEQLWGDLQRPAIAGDRLA